jgi:hypothetical protein
MPSLAFKNAERAGGFFSRAIELKTGSPFSHVEMWLTGPRENATCFSSREPNGTGYANINLSDPLLWTIIEIPATPEQMEYISWFCEGTGMKDYDFWGILGFVWPWGTHDDHDRFCSEWCTECLQRCLGLWPCVKPWRTSPGDLYKLASALKR